MAKKKRLSEIIAIEKGVKSKVNDKASLLYKELLQTVKFGGSVKTYVPKLDESDTLPVETKLVEYRAEDIFQQDAKLYTELVDIILTKDSGNRTAAADVEVDGKTLLTDVPATTLLYLEKMLLDVRAFAERMPVLDPGQNWTYDVNSRLYRADPVQTSRTKKTEKALVLYDAVIKDGVGIPAQTKTVTVDDVIGFYHKTDQCGALPLPRKELILSRVDGLLIAVRQARSRANGIEVESREIGQTIFNYLLGA